MPFFGRKKEEQAKPTPPLLRASPRIERVVWLGLKVADLLGESVFLEETLQLRFADEGNSGIGHHIRYNCGPVELELIDGGMTWVSRPRPKNGSPDIPLIASFTIDQIAPLVEELSEKEVPITQLFDQDWAASALFFDPERNIWQIEQLRTAPPVGSNRLEHIGTIWLECQDFERQVAFYRDILQMPLVASGGGRRPVTLSTETERRHPHPEPFPAFVESVERYEAAPNPEQIAVQDNPDALDDPAEVEPSENPPGEVSQENLVFEPQPNGYMPPSEMGGLEPLLTGTPEQLEASLVGQNPPAAIFFDEPTHLALVPGGRKPSGVQNRIWGRDVNLTLSFRAYDVNGLALKLRDAGYAVTAPAPDPDRRRGLSFTFTDPEGNVWQVAEWSRLPA